MKILKKILANMRRNEEGFTIAEVLVAFSVLAIVGTATAYYLTTSTQTISNNEIKDSATQYTREYMDRIKVVEYDKLGFDSSNAGVPDRVDRGGTFYDSVKEDDLDTSINGLTPRETVNLENKEYTVFTYIYWSDGTEPTNVNAYEQKTVEVEVWYDGRLVSAAKFTRTPTAAEAPAAGEVDTGAISDGQKVPEAPTVLATLTGDDDRQIALEFSALYAIDYRVEYSVNGGDWTRINHSSFSDTAVDPKTYTTSAMPRGAEVKVKITGINTAGSGASVTTTLNIPAGKPPAPNVFTQQGNDNKVTISWNPVEFADNYQIQHTVNGVPQSSKTVTGTTFTTRAYSPGDVIEVTVRGYNGSIAGDPGNASLTLVNRTPAVPAPVLSPAQQNLVVKWAAIDNASQYEVRYSINGVWQPVISTPSISANITGYGRNDTVVVTVRAGNSANSFSDYSAPLTYEADWVVPDAPVLSGTTDVNELTATVTWPAVTDAVNYEIYYIFGQSNSSKPLSEWYKDTQSTRSWTTDLTPGTPVFVKAYAVSSEGFRSEISNTYEGLIADKKPARITKSNTYKFRSSIDSSYNIKYQWNQVPYAVSYEIRFSDSTSWSNPVIRETSTISYDHKNIPNSYTAAQVRGVSASGLKGDWSDTITYKRGPGSAPSLTLSPTVSAVKAEWGAVGGATKYELQYKVNGSSSYNWSKTTTGSGSVNISSVPVGGDKVQVRARAVNSLGNGPWSSWKTQYAAFKDDYNWNSVMPSYNPSNSGGTWTSPTRQACEAGQTDIYATRLYDHGNWYDVSGYSNARRTYTRTFDYDYYPIVEFRSYCKNDTTGRQGHYTSHSDNKKGWRAANETNVSTWNNNSKLRFAQVVKRVYPYSGYSSTDWSNFRAGIPGTSTVYSRYSYAMQQAVNRHGNGTNLASDGYWGTNTNRKIVDALKGTTGCYTIAVTDEGLSETSQAWSNKMERATQRCFNERIQAGYW